MSYRRSAGLSFPFAAGAIILLRDTFSYVYYRFLGGLFPQGQGMSDTALNWIGVGLILFSALIYCWPQLKEAITGVPVPDETTPSGLKLYQGRVINLGRLAGHRFNGCIFVDVNLVKGAVIHIRNMVDFSRGYEIQPTNHDTSCVEADFKKTIVNAVQFDECTFIKSRIRARTIATDSKSMASFGRSSHQFIPFNQSGLKYK